MEKKQHTINLVGKNDVNFIDKFIKWALNAGRLIVIITEFTALSAFLYRFTLDSQIVDLHSQIGQEQETVKFYKPYEDTYRDLQDRLSLASNLSAKSNVKNKTIHDILNLSANSLSLNNLSLFDKSIQFDATARTASSLHAFVEALKAYPQITSVSIDTIETKPTSSTISVSIVANLRN